MADQQTFCIELTAEEVAMVTRGLSELAKAKFDSHAAAPNAGFREQALNCYGLQEKIYAQTH